MGGIGRRASGVRAGSGRVRAVVRAMAVALLAVPCWLLPAAQAQSVVEVLRQQRQQARAAEILATMGPTVPPHDIRLLLDQHSEILRELHARRAATRARADSIDAAERARSLAASARALSYDWRKTAPDEQGAFLARYREAYWQAVNPTRGNPLDTLATTTLRGRLQALFGAPTRNADAQRQVGYAGSENVQFEYWFVVNDSIPVLVMDVDGPFGRGLLLAGDENHAAYLPALAADLGQRLAATRRADPWVDYYRSHERRQWYRTGYNGETLFTLEIPAPAWSRRARVDRWNIHR